MKTKSFYFLSIFIVLFVSCTQEDDDGNAVQNSNCNIETSAAIEYNYQDDMTVNSVTAFDDKIAFNASLPNGNFTISVDNADFASAGEYTLSGEPFGKIVSHDYPFVTYTTFHQEVYTNSYPIEPAGQITISAFDEACNTISGQFWVKAYGAWDELNSDVRFEVTGSFAQVPLDGSTTDLESNSGTSGPGDDNGQTGSCPDTVIDGSGNTYQVVRIGNQCWINSNLTAISYNDGSSIDPYELQNGIFELPFYVDIYDDYWNRDGGRQYSSYVFRNEKNICPNGWRLPTKTEVEEMIDFLGGPVEASRAMKANYDWCSVNVFESSQPLICNPGTNSSGFGSTPTGRIYNYDLVNNGHDAYYWMIDENNVINGMGIYNINNYDYEPYNLNPEIKLQYVEYDSPKTTASCRCIKAE